MTKLQGGKMKGKGMFTSRKRQILRKDKKRQLIKECGLAAVTIYEELLCFVNRDNWHYSLKTLAEDLGMEERPVNRIMEKLRKNNWYWVDRTPKNGEPFHYHYMGKDVVCEYRYFNKLFGTRNYNEIADQYPSLEELTDYLEQQKCKPAVVRDITELLTPTIIKRTEKSTIIQDYDEPDFSIPATAIIFPEAVQ